LFQNVNMVIGIVIMTHRYYFERILKKFLQNKLVVHENFSGIVLNVYYLFYLYKNWSCNNNSA